MRRPPGRGRTRPDPPGSRWAPAGSRTPSGRRACPHVQLTDVAGELEAVSDQLAGHGRAQLVGPFVEVHRGVQAAGLLVLALVDPVGCSSVARPGRRGEEPEGVVVGAVDPMGLDDGVGAVRARAAAARRVPDLVGSAGRPSPTRAGRSSRAAPAGTRWRSGGRGSHATGRRGARTPPGRHATTPSRRPVPAVPRSTPRRRAARRPGPGCQLRSRPQVGTSSR